TVGSVVSKTFTIENNGTADLTLSELTLPTGLTLAGTFPTVIAAGSQGTFDVQLDTNTANTFNGELSFTTNDTDENPFNFAVSGVVSPNPVPEISVIQNTTNIADNTGTFDFGTSTVGSVVSKTFTIENNGT
ncbi:hypothetical protein M595_6512, partial [Lyngbya aestuarii BL J]